MDWGTISPKMTGRSVSGMSGGESKHTNEHGGAEHGGPAPSERPVEHNGKGLVGDNIAQKQRHQNPVLALVKQPQDLGRVLALGALARVGDDLQIDLILAHQAMCGLELALWKAMARARKLLRNGQAGKGPSKQHKRYGSAEIYPQAWIIWLLGLLLLEDSHGALEERYGPNERREELEKTEHQRVDAGGPAG